MSANISATSYKQLEQKSKLKNTLLRWFLYFVLILFASYFIFPLYVMIVTSDHGNADIMFNEKKLIQCTTHTTNPVPFIICENIKFKVNEGVLADIAPTILDLMKLEKPNEMDGSSLLA